MKLTTDVTLSFLLEALYVTGVDYEVNVLTNFCYISDRNTCTVKVNIKETFMENNGFLQTFI